MEKLANTRSSVVRDDLLGYGHQDVSEDDIRAVVDVLRSDFLTCGPATERFENAIKSAVGAGYVTAVANGTAALHVACLAAGVGPGDEVISSALSPSPLQPIACCTAAALPCSPTSIRLRGT